MIESPASPFDTARFIDHRGLDWTRVKRMRYLCLQRMRYDYPGPVYNLRQKLVVLPIERYGDQRLCDHQLTITPEQAAVRETTDYWGNHVLQVEVPYIARTIAFDVHQTVERTAGPHDLPTVDREHLALLRRPTTLTTADARILDAVRRLEAQTRSPTELAEQISDWVASAMRYGAGATAVTTTAAEALAIGQGLCQDYAHIMIAACRAAGIATRYVSGHMLGEGGSHAWVECLVPSAQRDGVEVIAFDPTNRQKPTLAYTRVAAGRDYGDVAPTSGTFTAPYAGSLSSFKRAGLTLLEYWDGQVITAGSRLRGAH